MKHKLVITSIILTLTSSLLATTATANDDDAIQALPIILSTILNNQTPDPTGCPDINSGVTLTTGFGSEADLIPFIFDAALDSFVTPQGVVTKVEGDLVIQIGPEGFGEINSTSNLSALNSIREVTGSISIEFNTNDSLTALETLEIFDCLSVVGRVLSIGQGEITSDTRLRKLIGFENLTRIGGLVIEAHDDLEELPSFDNLESTSLFGIGGTPRLQEIPSFESLTSGGNIFIDGAGEFDGIRGFQNLQSTDTVIISNNINLDCQNNVTQTLLPATSSQFNAVDCDTIN